MARQGHQPWMAVTAALLVAAMAGCGSSSQNTGNSATTAASLTTTPTRSAAAQLQQQYTEIVKTVAPEVVQIQTESGLGSGVVFDGKGNIVTNAHVVTRA